MQSIGPDLWILQKDKKVPGFGNIGMTMTVARLADGRIALISPVPMAADEAERIRLLGRVSWIISPNAIHHLYLRDALVHFPEAELWGPAKTVEKRVNLTFTGVMAAGTPSPWAPELTSFPIPARGPIHEEFVFFHARSRTLILTDLAFNLPEPSSFVNRLFLALNGALGRFTTTRLSRASFNNSAALREALAIMTAWRPENIVVAHGRPILGDGATRLANAFSWLE